MRQSLERILQQKFAWTAVRLALAWTFLWAFLDKTFGLGYATVSSKSWLNGGSPTEGYLKFAASGPLTDFYHSLAGNAAVDVLFMIALLFLGISLFLGIGLRIAAIGGTLLLLLMWSSALPPANNPIIDDHIVYMFTLIGLALANAGQWYGLGKWWANTPLVKRFPILG
jgi:thiosulfate dehydrogenase [quinone] large subunit